MLNWNRLLNVTTAGLTLGAVAAVGVFLRRELSPPTPARSRVTTSVVSDWMSYAKGGTRLGPDSAAVIITMFSDIRCAHCRAAWMTMQEIRRRYPERVALVYRHYPIIGFGLEASRAAVCAKPQGKFEALYNVYMGQQDSLRPRDSSATKSWLAFAKEAGVADTAAFRRCMSQESVPDEVALDRSEGTRLGVGGVPVILINETMVDGNPGAGVLDSLVARALARAGDAKKRS